MSFDMLSKSRGKKIHDKNKRKFVFPSPSLIGFIFNNRFQELEVYDSKTSKFKYNGHYVLDLKLCFFWPGSYVEIHNNPDNDLSLSFKEYIKKITLIKTMCQEMAAHISDGKGVLVKRNFLNDETVNDGFGATLFMTADPEFKENYCIFEISSCFKKYRYGTNPSTMKKYIRDLLSLISDLEQDLKIVEEKLKSILPEVKDGE